jgi:hypothetical protein
MGFVPFVLKVVTQNFEAFADVSFFPAYITSTFQVLLGWNNQYTHLAMS